MANKTVEIQDQELEKEEIVEGEAERTRARPAFVPRADIYETNGSIKVVVDMPGVNEDTVDVTLEQNVLTIDGYVAPVEHEGYRLAYSEYRVGDYQRSFTLSGQIDRDKIEASVSGGVLHLHLPKAEPTTRKIAVKAG
jgi:HSP20 family molecular chaperone IbpA